MTLQGAGLLVYHVEEGAHRLIVGDALGVAAAHDTMQLIGNDDLFLLHHVEVTYDVEYYVRSYYRESAYLLVREELVGHLDGTLLANLLASDVISDGNA